jgi:hypothetical protein
VRVPGGTAKRVYPLKTYAPVTGEHPSRR